MTYKSPLWPVSVKGVALDAHERVLLLRNERNEWELPGGRLEIGNPGSGQAPTAGRRRVVWASLRATVRVVQSATTPVFWHAVSSQRPSSWRVIT